MKKKTVLLLFGTGFIVSAVMDNLFHAPLWFTLVICAIIGIGWATLTKDQTKQ